MHGLAPANARKRGSVRNRFSASSLSASSRVAALIHYPCQPPLTETLTTTRDEAVCAIQQRAAALPVALHERLNSSTQRLNLPALAHQWRPREELQVVVVVALLPSSPSERVWLAAAGLSEACGSAPARSNALESDCQKRNTH